MKSLRKVAVTTALTLSLACLAWAAPRVAIVTPMGGEVKLAGAPLKAPRIAEEGQILSLGESGKVRVQLLGSGKEQVLSGANNYTISKTRLESEAKVLTRGSISVADEIGNLSRAGAASQRNYKPLGLSVQWPPSRQGDVWVAQVTTPSTQIPVSKNDPITITVTDLSDSEAIPVEVILEKPVTALAFKDLVVGHRYQVDVQKDQAVGYKRVFRILDPEEQEALVETAGILRAQALELDEFPSLLRLASLYQSFDKTDKVVEVLTEAVNNPQYATLDAKVRQQLLDTLNKARWSQDQSEYKLKS